MLKNKRFPVLTSLAALWLLGAVLSSLAAEPRQFLHGHVSGVAAHLTPLGILPATNQLHLAIGLPLRNEGALNRLLQEIYDPASTNYHRYLTPAQFTAQFGPTVADYEAVRKFTESNGFTVIGAHDSRMVLDVQADSAAVENAFQVTLRTYRHPKENRDFFAPDVVPSVPTNLPVADVWGLSDFARPHPLAHFANPAQATQLTYNGSGANGSYRGTDFRNAYAPGAGLTGSGQTVAVAEFDGYYQTDITSYEAQSGYASVPLTNVLINVTGTPGYSGIANAVLEVSMDIELAIAMAPGLSKVMVYEGSSPYDVFNQIASDNLAKQISCSWTWGGGPSTIWSGPGSTLDSLLKKMGTQGQAFFQASGDSDAYTGSQTLNSSTGPIPVDSIYVTSVGGTSLSMNGTGASWSSEAVWNWNSTQSKVGSGGGVSPNYSIPSWQTNVSMALNGGSTVYRNLPDVAMPAEAIYVIYNNGSSSGSIGGTSAAAPLWAGFCALINQQSVATSGTPIGFLNPAIYRLAATTNYANCFHDITAGNNIGTGTAGLYNAAAGYDLCTGLGSPNGINLINALAPPVYFIAMTNAGWTLLAESAAPPNGAVDPGETVTVSFTLQNQGTLAPGNLVATLQPNAGVLAPSGPQSYGTVAAYGGSASQPFTFTAAGTCGSNIVANLQMQDGTNNLGTVNFTLQLGGFSTNHTQTYAQNFDGVTAPALPSGWTTTTISGTANSWVITTAASDTSPNSAFISDLASTSENALVSPMISIVSANAQLSFRHNYSFDYHSASSHAYRDGGVLEIKIGGGTFTDILTAGGSFVVGGYNNKINTANNNPLNGRSAWVGIFNSWQTVTVNLPATAAGQNIQLRWNCGTDSSNTGTGAVGWYVDSISITDAVFIANCLSVFTDLAASQSLATNSLQPGQNLVYTLAVTNLGPQAAANVLVTDTVPANATLVSASPGYSYSAGQLVWSAGMLPVAAATNFTLTLSPASGNVFTNVASVGTVTPEITATGNTATLISTQTVSVSASISAGPVGQSVQCGGSATFTVAATGTAPVSIQWSLDGTPVAGATNANFSLTNLHPPSHTIAVTVTNVYGSVTSNTVVTIIDTLPPVIALNGGNPIVVELGSAFTDPGATANDICAGVVPVTIAGGVNTSSVGTNTLTYIATDGNGNTNTAMRTVIVRDTTPPAISWSFTNLVLAADTNCGVLMPDVTGTNYLLATDLSGALTISQIPTNNFILPLGTNVVVIAVTDASGNTAFSTNTIVVQDQTPPLILSQPQSQTNLVGATASFSVAATACTPLTCQWFFNSAVLTNQTNSTLTLASVNLTNAGNYSVTVTASGGSTNSAVATLTVFDPAPVIAGVAANPGGSFTLNLAGAPGSTYILETTTNLVPVIVWLPIATNTLDASGVWQFTDPQAVNFLQQFYRLELAP